MHQYSFKAVLEIGGLHGILSKAYHNLDSTGVINLSRHNKGYIADLKYFKWVPGAIKNYKIFKKK